ncbi:hypothetical protein QQ020_32250 [Fulvivirgaceae bacterium BMA12]|uniref:Monoheme cytochrome c n=1 Tax=Agaribacillus aureus TaxID=3051825 RepID=A0ABT8LG98_9BACT|nr:hypothetical protein [Fulvivirgaceae bacterium BMA12]
MNKRFFLIITGFLIVILLVFSYFADRRRIDEKSMVQSDQSNLNQGVSVVMKPVDDETGLIIGPGFNLVKTNCLGCHSGKLITQNRANREAWKATIRWMQQTQNLWDLGENEPKILDYLSKNYAPQQMGRRAPLQDVEWYDLQE